MSVIRSKRALALLPRLMEGTLLLVYASPDVGLEEALAQLRQDPNVFMPSPTMKCML